MRGLFPNQARRAKKKAGDKCAGHDNRYQQGDNPSQRIPSALRASVVPFYGITSVVPTLRAWGEDSLSRFAS